MAYSILITRYSAPCHHCRTRVLRLAFIACSAIAGSFVQLCSSQITLNVADNDLRDLAAACSLASDLLVLAVRSRRAPLALVSRQSKFPGVPLALNESLALPTVATLAGMADSQILSLSMPVRGRGSVIIVLQSSICVRQCTKKGALAESTVSLSVYGSVPPPSTCRPDGQADAVRGHRASSEHARG